MPIADARSSQHKSANSKPKKTNPNMMKLKELDLESETFSLGEIACVFAGRFDLFVSSFAGKPKNRQDPELSMNNLSARA